MARLVVLLLIVGLAWLVYRLLTRASAHTPDATLPAPAACPRCRRMLTLSEIACANCGRQGEIRRTVYRERGIAESRFDCAQCRTQVEALPCPECETNLAGVFSARSDRAR